jgi:diaminopimelate epimerase
MKYELYSGAGNDFVMIDNITEKIALDRQEELTVKLCNENFPKIDGVIFADKPLKSDSAIRMNYYNKDGSFGAMCGNGARCTAMFIYKKGITSQSKFTLEAVDDVYSAEIINDEIVKIGFPEPKEIRTGLKIESENAGSVKPLNVSYVNVGSDHIILFINEEINKLFLSCSHMDKLDVDNTGRNLRFHKAFEPRGGNVNFAEILADNTIRLRTYERGVERETLACGTGIISTGVIAMLEKGFTSPVKIKVQSGEVLEVEGKVTDGKISELSLTGSARKIGDGSL